MSNLPILKQQYFDNSGDVLNGGLLYTYAAGTTTPLATYSDEALGSANTNPLVLDSAGRLQAEVFLTANTGYKFVLKTSAGTTLETTDNVYGTQLSSASVVARLAQVASDPVTQGAVGDGVADESTEVQAAIDAATGVVDLLGKTYRCDSGITLSSGLILRNGTLDFSNCPDDYYITLQGSEGDANLLTGNASLGDKTLSLTNVTGLAAGDLLRLYSTAQWYGANELLGELVEIDALSSLDANLRNPIECGYATADSAAVREITPVQNVRFEHLKIIGSEAAAGAGTAILLQNCKNIDIVDCQFVSFKGDGVLSVTSWGVRIRNCIFDTSAAAAIGVYVISCSQHIDVKDCLLTRMTTGVGAYGGTPGPVRFLTVKGCTVLGCSLGMYATEGSQYVRFENNTVVNNATGTASTGAGIKTAGIDWHVKGNVIREAGGDGIRVGPGAHGSTMTYTTNKPWFGFVTENYIDVCDDVGINAYLDAAGIVGGVVVANNIISSPGGKGIVLAGNNIAAIGNTVGAPANHGISLEVGGDGIRVIGNHVSGFTGAGVYGISVANTAGDEFRNCVIEGNTIQRADDLAEGIKIAGAGADDVIGMICKNNVIENGTSSISASNYQSETCSIERNLAFGVDDYYDQEEGSPLHHLHCVFDPSAEADQRTADTTYAVGLLPKNAVVLRSLVYVKTTFQSAGGDAATIGIGINTDDTNGIVAAIAISDGTNPWDAGWHAGIQDDTTGNASEITTAPRAVDVVVGASQALTAGKMHIYLWYVIAS